MKSILFGVSVTVLCITLSSCAAEKISKEPLVMPGSDRDAKGCIGSAGYAWCAHTQQCERPWELAKQKGFNSSEQGFDTFCKQK